MFAVKVGPVIIALNAKLDMIYKKSELETINATIIQQPLFALLSTALTDKKDTQVGLVFNAIPDMLKKLF
jgi:hypothetical protein